jgi:hypothetical protein
VCPDVQHIVWLIQHDFDKKDVQLPKSELMGSRLSVFIVRREFIAPIVLEVRDQTGEEKMAWKYSEGGRLLPQQTPLYNWGTDMNQITGLQLSQARPSRKRNPEEEFELNTDTMEYLPLGDLNGYLGTALNENEEPDIIQQLLDGFALCTTIISPTAT